MSQRNSKETPARRPLHRPNYRRVAALIILAVGLNVVVTGSIHFSAILSYNTMIRFDGSLGFEADLPAHDPMLANLCHRARKVR